MARRVPPPTAGKFTKGIPPFSPKLPEAAKPMLTIAIMPHLPKPPDARPLTAKRPRKITAFPSRSAGLSPRKLT